MAHKIVSRAEAIKRGLPTYFTGKPCPNGHIDLIYVNGRCRTCKIEGTNKSRAKAKAAKAGKAAKSKAAPAQAAGEVLVTPVTPVTDDDALLVKINKAVAEVNKAENVVVSAQTELVSKSKVVGALLLEAKKRHSKVAEFEAFLKRVDGLKLSRAYDLMRLAGGRVTDAELRDDARERQQKSRAKRKLPPSPPLLPEPEPASDAKSPHSVTEPHVTETREIDDDEQQSARAFGEFTKACETWLPLMNDIDLGRARSLVLALIEPILNGVRAA
jgi:hypothetical protein